MSDEPCAHDIEESPLGDEDEAVAGRDEDHEPGLDDEESGRLGFGGYGELGDDDPRCWDDDDIDGFFLDE